ncbi:class I SAM-dependent methyltransferase [Methermicoccus shengliensis]|uniref:Methyltransferase domain-containing protein n=1 Tax=Methermicoccus shengliensis TaxID=660064 RepID=A0A832RYM9_9EURY|nr:class I SAM-dependent methyltransferase [Methermicoccus shengliensis]HIH70214.1 methyltransferase domain-containing protein [Methermicoccus shengliensis]
MSDARRYVGFYDTPLGRSILLRERELIQRELVGCGCVLDVGCGPGVFEGILDMRMVGLDMDRNMLHLAPHHATCTFVQGMAEHLPFGEQSFDGVVCITSLEFMEDVDAALGEAHRVLSSGGRLLALVLNPLSEYVERRRREGGYFARIRHTPEEIVRRARAHFALGWEYWLGISEEAVYDSQSPREAALCVIKGVKLS